MINTQYLMDLIEKSGKKIGYLADKLGLSRAGFYKKIHGKSSFTEKEATILCEELGVTTLSERKKIFCI